MGDETNPSKAREIADVIKKIFPTETIDFSQTHPISDLLRRTPQTVTLNTKRVQFPFTVTDVLGKGVNAIVVRIRDASARIFAMRISSDYSQNEHKIQELLARYQMAPRVYLVLRAGALMFTIMDKISDILENYVSKPFDENKLMVAIKCLLDKKELLNVVHGDMHLANIAILQDGSTLGFIDFEFATIVKPPAGKKMSELVTIDFIPFIGDLRRFKSDKARQHLATRVVQYYRDTFQLIIRVDSLGRGKGGGFRYHNLTSYIISKSIYSDVTQETFAEDVEQYAVDRIHEYFPSFRMPKIVR